MIVVKLLYDKHELMTLPGRLTLGVLVFQDVWAILVLALQPSLMNPSAATLLASLAKGAALVVFSLAASRYLLPRLFALIAKVPELLLVTALAWCFLVSGVASALGLSREMGALIAGVGMSTFPYNLDVIAKVVNIRDFFVTLFFVALGMQIPMPTTATLAGGHRRFGLPRGHPLRSRSFPILLATRLGLRASLLPAINLAQMSEFSLVILALGLSLGHVSAPDRGGDDPRLLHHLGALDLHDREQPRAAGAARPRARPHGAQEPRRGRRGRRRHRQGRGGGAPRLLPRRELAPAPVRDGGQGRRGLGAPGDADHRLQPAGPRGAEAARHPLSLRRHREHGDPAPRLDQPGAARGVHPDRLGAQGHLQPAHAEAAARPTAPPPAW